MAKCIKAEPIIGNFLISQKKGYITKEDLHNYYEKVDELLPEEYYTSDNISLEEFCYQYNFLVTTYKDIVIPLQDTKTLLRYFRLGLPKSIISVFDEAARSLEEENKTSTEYKFQYLQYTMNEKIEQAKVKQKKESEN